MRSQQSLSTGGWVWKTVTARAAPRFFQGRNFKKPQENNFKNSKKPQQKIHQNQILKNIKSIKKNPTHAVEKKTCEKK